MCIGTGAVAGTFIVFLLLVLFSLRLSSLCEMTVCAAYLIANSKHEGIITCACLGLHTCECAPGNTTQGLPKIDTNFHLNTLPPIKSFRIPVSRRLLEAQLVRQQTLDAMVTLRHPCVSVCVCARASLKTVSVLG